MKSTSATDLSLKITKIPNNTSFIVAHTSFQDKPYLRNCLLLVTQPRILALGRWTDVLFCHQAKTGLHEMDRRLTFISIIPSKQVKIEDIVLKLVTYHLNRWISTCKNSFKLCMSIFWLHLHTWGLHTVTSLSYWFRNCNKIVFSLMKKIQLFKLLIWETKQTQRKQKWWWIQNNPFMKEMFLS